MLITWSQHLHASSFVGYALSFEELIRQIMLWQRWRGWFLSTIVGDYIIFPIEANGIGHLSLAETGYRDIDLRMEMLNVSRWSPCHEWTPTHWGCSAQHKNCRL